jgi:hypothetical protein
MVNTVKRGAGRPAHAERTSRHSQRTPLPPRPGQVEEARGMLALVPEGSKSPLKARAFIKDAAALGWEPTGKSYHAETDSAALTVSRDGEDITIVWERGVFQQSDYTGYGRQLKLINASAAKKRMAMPAESAVAEAKRVQSAPRPGTPRAARSAKPRALPFGEESLDEAVLDAVRGRRIAWRNRISSGEEVDRVTTNSRHLTIMESPSGRVLSFLGENGFRSVLVSSIIRVR